LKSEMKNNSLMTISFFSPFNPLGRKLFLLNIHLAAAYPYIGTSADGK